MKICLINNLYPPFSKGGAETVVETLAGGLIERGHSVMVITLGQKDEVIEDNVKIFRVKPWNIFSFLEIEGKQTSLRFLWWFFNVFNFSAYKKIEKILKDEHPDVVHTHNLVGLGFLLPRLIKKLNIKHVHTLHDIQLVYPSGQLSKGSEKIFINTFFLRQWYEILVRKLFGSPAVITSPSDWLSNFYDQRGFFPNALKRVLLNPINTTLGRQLTLKRPSDFIFLFVGRMEEYKGVYILLEAFKKISVNSSTVKLRLVGTGRDLKKVQDLTQGNEQVSFFGQLNRERLDEQYVEADYLVMPTLVYENSPTVILEALAHGLPVVASDIGGIPELVKEGATGFLCQAGEVDDLARAMASAMNNNQDLTDKCLEKAKPHRLEVVLKRLEEIYYQ